MQFHQPAREPGGFLSANPHFCKSALSRFTQWDFIDLVKRHRIEYFEKMTVNGLSGQLFCRQSSKQIVAMLLDECARAGVEIRTACETSGVTHKDAYRLATNRVYAVHCINADMRSKRICVVMCSLHLTRSKYCSFFRVLSL